MRLKMRVVSTVAALAAGLAGLGGWPCSGAEPAAHPAAPVTHPAAPVTHPAAPAVASGCGTPAAAPGKTTTAGLTVDGVERTYRLHLPANYRDMVPAPLIVAFHGHDKTARYMETLTGMSRLDDYVVAYPQGLPGTDGETAWEGAPYAAPGVDDVRFVDELLTHLQDTVCLDPARLFVAGKSNGGGFATLLACELAGRVAAAGSMAGAYYGESRQCVQRTPTPVIEIHGTGDGTAPYDGSVKKKLPSVPAWLEEWRVRDGCSTDVVTATAAEMTTSRWQGCAADLVHERIDDWPHAWASTTPTADTSKTTTVDATDEMVRFFDAHPLH